MENLENSSQNLLNANQNSLHETDTSDSPNTDMPQNSNDGGKSAKEKALAQLAPVFDNFPLYLREGPWSPFAYFYIVLCFVVLCISVKFCADDYKQPPLHNEKTWLFWYRIVIGVGSLLSVCPMFYVVPLTLGSYTMTSYLLMSFRLITAACGWSSVANVLRFPALVGCTITFTIWWVVIFPCIYLALSKMEGNPEVRKKWLQGFVQFNKSPMLLNVHGLIFPFVLIEFLGTNEKLQWFDLWLGGLQSFLYLTWYLFVVQANGFHIYIPFSPRTHFCIIIWPLAHGIYCGIYFLSNWWLGY